MICIDWLTETTGNPVCLATRSAVRCRVPDSVVSMVGSGTSWVAARRIRVTSRSRTMRAVHLGQLAQPGGGELDVEREAAGADGLDDPVVAEHDEGAGAAAQDPLEAVAQLGARRDGGERRPQQLVVGAALPPRWLLRGRPRPRDREVAPGGGGPRR